MRVCSRRTPPLRYDPVQASPLAQGSGMQKRQVPPAEDRDAARQTGGVGQQHGRCSRQRGGRDRLNSPRPSPFLRGST
ncbi:uncharacterized protein V6R79_014622 [Siganus canaliculatus]